MKSDIIHQMAHIGKMELLQYLLREDYADVIAFSVLWLVPLGLIDKYEETFIGELDFYW